MEISRSVAAAIRAEAAAAPDREVCGLLFGTIARIEAHRACRNVSIDPARRFEIDPAALIAAHRAARGGGPAVIGHYHSHPSGSAVPSPRDEAAALDIGAIWVIAGDELRGWRVVAPHRFKEAVLSVS